jgi:hypothetical protein
MIVSQSMLKKNTDKLYYIDGSFTIFNPEFMRVKEGENRGAPNRTFSYGKYQPDGYSDHFPVFILLGK